MAYASIEDVEARGGVVFNEDDASIVNAFIEDFSLYLDIIIEQAGKEPTQIDPKILKVITSRRALDYILYSTKSGVSSRTQSVGDISETVSYESANRDIDDFLYLTPREKQLIGLSNSGFVSWSFYDDTRRKL